MFPAPSLCAATEQAQAASRLAAESAGVRVGNEVTLRGFGEIETLFNTVWLLPPGESAIPTELLRSISHAGCNVTFARDESGRLVGAAAAIVTPQSASMYSLIAGVLPGIADRGVGFALKQHQRAWALERDLTEMTWTFDPLVSRNARFNLTKLGAQSSEYAVDFYGPMQGDMNANDESDRLVAVWQLLGEESAACSEDRPVAVDRPEFGPEDVLRFGPDDKPALVAVEDILWCRVPTDIVALRGSNPSAAARWRRSIRSVLTDAFASGHIARGVSRDGWYRLVPGGTA